MLYTYFAHDDNILVLAARTWAVGWKSMAMCKISTKTNQVIMLQAVPIRCLNPQPRMVILAEPTKFFFLRYLKYIGNLSITFFQILENFHAWLLLDLTQATTQYKQMMMFSSLCSIFNLILKSMQLFNS